MSVKRPTEGTELLPPSTEGPDVDVLAESKHPAVKSSDLDLQNPEEAGCWDTCCGCLKCLCRFLFNLPFIHTSCLIVSIVAASAAVSGDHKTEDHLSQYGLNIGWLTKYLYVVLSCVTILNATIVASAQYVNSYHLLKSHRLQREDGNSLECLYKCIDSMGNCFVGLTRLAFLTAYLTAIAIILLTVATAVIAIIIEALHLLCDNTSEYIVWAALEGLQQLPIGLDFKLDSRDDVEAFCSDINKTNNNSLKAAIFTAILAVSQVTITICAWNTLMMMKFRTYVQEEDALLKTGVVDGKGISTNDHHVHA